MWSNDVPVTRRCQAGREADTEGRERREREAR